MALLEPGTTLARYTLLGKLATGGMAEVYLARQSGASGFSKVVVIKVILPHLASNATFMRMFRNEAKLAALLNHPGVVQIFDYGEERGLPYMAMEYIDGRNLNRIGKTLHQRGDGLPRPIALRVVSDTCGALDYAHGLTDPQGNHLRIVHRDISRENVLVTYSGQVKLVDFGIAKATFLEGTTTSGVLKGKYSYMAPEIIRGQEPDHRIDIYGVGVVLYAMLLRRMPYKASNTAQLLDQINNKEPDPPRSVDPSLPEELEQIVLRAMHKDKAQRYQTAGELQADLERYLMEHESAVLPYHLAQFMKVTFPPGTDKDRETYQSLTGATPAEPSGVPLGAATGRNRTVSTAALPPSRRGLWAVVVVLLGAAGAIAAYLALRPPREAPLARAPSAADATVAAPRAPGPDLAGVAVPASAPDTGAPPATTVGTKKAPPRPPRAQLGHLSVSAPTPGEVLAGKRRLGALPLAHVPLRAGTHLLTVRSPRLGYSMTQRVKLAAGAHQQLKLTPRKGTIRIMVHPWARVTLDGKLLGITPLDPVKVYEGQHLLVFENSDLKATERRTVVVEPDKVALVKLLLR